MPTMWTRLRSTWTPWLLMAVPPVLIGYLMLRYNVDMVIKDEWDSMPAILFPLEAGTFKFSYLFYRHGEHILFMTKFTELVLFFLHAKSRWYAYALLWTLGLGIAVLQTRIANRTLKGLGLPPNPCLGVLCFVSVFSIGAWENWYWGIQDQVLYAMFFALGALSMLYAARSAAGYVAASVLAVLSSVSLTNGTGVWLAGALVVVLKARTARGRWKGLAAWLGAGALTVTLMFTLYPLTADMMQQPGGLAGNLHRPERYFKYLWIALGRDFATISTEHETQPMEDLSRVIGFLATLAFAWAVVMRGRIAGWRREAFAPLAVSLSAALFALLSLGMAAVGRSNFGLAQALASRLSSTASPFWCVLATLLWVVAQTALRGQRPIKVALGTLLAVLLCLFVYASALNFPRWEKQGDDLRYARAALLSGKFDDPSILREVVHQPPVLNERFGLFVRLGYPFAQPDK